MKVLQYLFATVMAYNLACVCMPSVVRNWQVVAVGKVTETGEIQREPNADRTPLFPIYAGIHFMQLAVIICMLGTMSAKGIIAGLGILVAKMSMKALIPFNAAIRLSGAIAALCIGCFMFL